MQCLIESDFLSRIREKKENQLEFYNIINMDQFRQKGRVAYKSIHSQEYNQFKKHLNENISLPKYEQALYDKALLSLRKEHPMPLSRLYRQFQEIDYSSNTAREVPLTQEKNVDISKRVSTLEQWKKKTVTRGLLQPQSSLIKMP